MRGLRTPEQPPALGSVRQRPCAELFKCPSGTETWFQRGLEHEQVAKKWGKQAGRSLMEEREEPEGAAGVAVGTCSHRLTSAKLTFMGAYRVLNPVAAVE